jgi:hypothetical protein
MKVSMAVLRRLAPVCALALTFGLGSAGNSQAAIFGAPVEHHQNFFERLIGFFVGSEARAETVKIVKPVAVAPFTYLQLDVTDIDAAIATAATMTGVPLSYMQATAMKESSGDPTAEASTSTAKGLYQVVDGTWLELMRRYGAKYGLAAEAAEVVYDGAGDPYIADGAERQRVLDLRFDVRVSALLAAELAAENMRILAAGLGRPASDNDLYIAHFIGPAEAVRLIAMAANSPSSNAAAAFPKEAASNAGVFYSAGGAPRSCAQVITRLALA